MERLSGSILDLSMGLIGFTLDLCGKGMVRTVRNMIQGLDHGILELPLEKKISF